VRIRIPRIHLCSVRAKVQMTCWCDGVVDIEAEGNYIERRKMSGRLHKAAGDPARLHCTSTLLSSSLNIYHANFISTLIIVLLKKLKL
jgi:hypothetical protein